jgi:hypothetical protein
MNLPLSDEANDRNVSRREQGRACTVPELRHIALVKSRQEQSYSLP